MVHLSGSGYVQNVGGRKPMAEMTIAAIPMTLLEEQRLCKKDRYVRDITFWIHHYYSQMSHEELAKFLYDKYLKDWAEREETLKEILADVEEIETCREAASNLEDKVDGLEEEISALKNDLDHSSRTVNAYSARCQVYKHRTERVVKHARGLKDRIKELSPFSDIGGIEI